MRLNYLLVLIVIAGICSCNKDKTVTSNFSFTYNGTNISGNNYQASYLLSHSTGNYNFTGTFYGSNSGIKAQLTFGGLEYIQPGTYQAGSIYANNISGTLNLFVDSAQFETSSGSFQVTQIDTVNHLISGKFQFNGVNVLDMYQTVTVNNGSFSNISYAVQ